jgi:hypothetical protein
MVVEFVKFSWPDGRHADGKLQLVPVNGLSDRGMSQGQRGWDESGGKSGWSGLPPIASVMVYRRARKRDCRQVL